MPEPRSRLLPRAVLVAGALVAVLLGALALLGPLDRTATTRPTSPARPVALPPVSWTSGAGTADARAFGAFRGRPVQVWNTWNDAGSWEDMRQTWTLESLQNSSFTGRVSFAQPLLDDSSSYPQCVAGAYDADFAAIAGKLAASGYADAFVRLGWEMNGDWYHWYVGDDYEGFRGCFSRASKIFKAASPAFVIEWNPAATDSGVEPARTYPGDDVVDQIGADFYDGWPVVGSDADFDAKCLEGSSLAPVGLCRFAEFARLHGKKFSVPEWGIRKEADIGTSDNPLFVRRMFAFFEANRDILAYECYFDLQGERFELSTGKNPRSAQAYRALWGSLP